MKINFLPPNPPHALKFSADIRVVSREEFNAIARNGNLYYTDHERSIAEQVRLKPSGITTDTYDCNNLAFYDDRVTSLFHLLPLVNLCPSILIRLKEAILTDTNTLASTGKSPHAFLCGGYNFPYPLDKEVQQDSRQLCAEILKGLRQAGISRRHISGLWGRRSHQARGGTSIIVLPEKKEIIVNLNRLDGKQVIDRASLEKTVSLIHIAPGDRVILKNEIINSPFLIPKSHPLGRPHKALNGKLLKAKLKRAVWPQV